MTQAVAVSKFYAYLNSSWTLLLDTGKVQDPRVRWGMSNNTPLDRVADTGEVTFTLSNPTGVYTPGGPNALAGWRKGVPFKWVVTYDNEDFTRFRGYISNIRIPKRNTDKKAYVTAVDWLDYADKHPLINPGIQTSKRGDEVLTTTVGLVAIAPQNTNFDTGIETFPTAFDTTTSHTTAYAEIGKVAFSELGYVYLKKDGTYGETLKFESTDTRYGWKSADNIPTPTSLSGALLKEDSGYLLKEDGGKLTLNESAAFTFDSSVLRDFEAPYGENVINRMTVYAYPRRLDTSAQILFKLDNEIVIGSGQSYTLKGYYANPSGGLQVNGQSMVTPVATTDYTMFTATAGGGSDITADLSISITYGTEGFTAVLTNNNAATGYVNKFNTRGTGIYLYNPIEHAATNGDSIDEFEAESETLHQKYKNTLYAGRIFVDSQVEQYKDPRVVLRSVTFCANSSPSNMMAFLYGDVGNLYYISISELGITGNYYIQGVEVDFDGGLIMVKWIVIVALSLQTGCGLSPLAVDFGGGNSNPAVIDYGYLPRVAGDSVTQFSISLWLYQRSITATSQVVFTLSGTGAEYLYVPGDGGGVRKLTFSASRFSGGSGTWSIPDNSYSLNAWVHIVVTYVLNVSADPLIYINGVSKTLTKNTTPSGTLISSVGAALNIGALLSSSGAYVEGTNAIIKDVRFYANKILSQAEVTTLYNSGTMDASLVTDGITFQAFAVRTGDLASYTDQTLTSSLKLFEAQYLTTGAPHNSPTGRAP